MRNAGGMALPGGLLQDEPARQVRGLRSTEPGKSQKQRLEQPAMNTRYAPTRSGFSAPTTRSELNATKALMSQCRLSKTVARMTKVTALGSPKGEPP